MADLPTNRTSANTDAEHIADHNAAHQIINEMQADLLRLRELIDPTPIDPPVAAFTATPLTGTAPVTVTFTENSSGNPTSYSWDFGDGGRSILANPTHSYAAGGKYTVSLTVTAAGGMDTMTRAEYVNVTLVTVTPVTITPTAGDGFAKIAWTAYPNATTYKVGRNGVDTDGAGAWQETVTGLEWTALKLNNGSTYALYVIPIVNGADGPTSTVNVTPTSGSVTPPPVGSSSPLAGGTTNRRSGLIHNIITFRGGESDTYPQVESWLGRSVDGVMTFHWSNWDYMGQTIPRRPGDLMIFSISPFAPNTGQTNATVAAGQQDSLIQQWANKLKAAGWNTNRTIIRLGWENNGNWYPWGWDRGGPDAYKNAFRRWVIVARATGLTNVIWDWCLNKGPQSYNSGYSWTTAYPGDDVVDVIGIDHYDAYGPQRNESEWIAQTVNRNPGIEDVAAFCRSHNKLISIDECGPCWRDSAGNMVGAGDNPWYITRLIKWAKDNAGIVAWVTIYDHPGAPSSLRHTLSDGSNPLAAAAMKKPVSQGGWGPG